MSATAPRISDLAILVRFNPESVLLPVQCLCQSFEGEWVWVDMRGTGDGGQETRLLPFVFGSHAEADAARELHPFTGKWDGARHLPWAVVRGNPALEMERMRRRESRDAVAEQTVDGGQRTVDGKKKTAVAPDECFRRNAARLGERL